MEEEQSKLIALVEQKQSILTNYIRLKDELDAKSRTFSNVRSLLYKIEGAIEYLEEKGVHLPD
jgi:hypothetical protein